MMPTNGQKTWPSNVHRVVPDVWTPPSQPRKTTFAARRGSISQRDLAELKQLKREQDEAKRRYESKRQELINAWNGGATVESGDLVLNIEEVAGGIVEFRGWS